MGASRRPPPLLLAGALLAAGLYWAYPLILPLRFVSEEIRIIVEAPDLVNVEAKYDLVNPSPLPVQLPFDYPLPPDRPGRARWWL